MAEGTVRGSPEMAPGRAETMTGGSPEVLDWVDEEGASIKEVSDRR